MMAKIFDVLTYDVYSVINQLHLWHWTQDTKIGMELKYCTCMVSYVTWHNIASYPTQVASCLDSYIAKHNNIVTYITAREYECYFIVGIS